jgi:DNA polymerase elongation subunit (family B)
MYPYVMANFAHPIGAEYNWRRGDISEDTVFVDVECRNHGAFVSREKDNPLDASPGNREGRFYTTIWEYQVAKKYGLIENDTIIGVVDNTIRSTFERVILPLYMKRQEVKKAMEALRVSGLEDTTQFEELKKQDLFLKYLLNNIFGKFAQNPRNFKEYYYTDVGMRPPEEWMKWLKGASDDEVHKFGMPVERSDDFEIWAKPSPGRRYNNVGTASSITGAARAVLLEAIQHAREPIYCDTDSLMCRELDIDAIGSSVDVSKLGAWKLEATFDRVIVAGRKLYACEVQGYADGHEKRIKVRSKGAAGLKWPDFEKMLDNQIIETINKAPTISKTGEQQYMRRRIRATAPVIRRRSDGNSNGLSSRARG